MAQILGIDTSNYTTSAALLDLDTGMIHQAKQLLPVKPGEAGLRQSDAVFREMAEQVISGLHQKLSLHDFRLVSGENSNRLIFDLVVPFDCTYTDEDLLEMISGELNRMDRTCYVSITFDRDFTEE